MIYIGIFIDILKLDWTGLTFLYFFLFFHVVDNFCARFSAALFSKITDDKLSSDLTLNRQEKKC